MAKKNKAVSKKTKKVVAVGSSDWHLHNWKNYNKDQRRLKVGLEVVDRLQKICTELGVPLLFPGDLFHNDQALPNEVIEHVFPVFQEKFNDRFLMNPFEMYGIDGNHDQPGQNTKQQRCEGYVEHLSKVFKGLHCMNFESKDLKNFGLHGIPYITRNEGFVEAVNDIKLIKNKPNILMIHSDLPGAKDTNQRVVGTVRNIPERLSDLFARFDLVISGHIHKAQIMDDNVIMIGAPTQQRKTDIGCKMGYWLIYNDMSYEFVPFKGLPKFKIVTEDPGDDKHYYIIENKTSKKIKDVEGENKRDFNVLMSRKKLVNNYMKETGEESKARRKKLKTLLSNA